MRFVTVVPNSRLLGKVERSITQQASDEQSNTQQNYDADPRDYPGRDRNPLTLLATFFGGFSRTGIVECESNLTGGALDDLARTRRLIDAQPGVTGRTSHQHG